MIINRLSRFLPLFYFFIVLLGMTACNAPVDSTYLDQPLVHDMDETKFVVSPRSGRIKLGDVVDIAKVLRRYRDLDAAEKALVKLAVRRHFDGLIAMELRKLEQVNVRERQRISRIPDAAARKAADAALSAKLLAEAARRVSARLSGPLAVPLKTSTNQSVIAFARVVSDDVRVADAAYEIDTSLDRVGAGTKIATADAPEDRALQEIRRSGAMAQVVAGAAVSIK
jgi:hypothetical protein